MISEHCIIIIMCAAITKESVCFPEIGDLHEHQINNYADSHTNFGVHTHKSGVHMETPLHMHLIWHIIPNTSFSV